MDYRADDEGWADGGDGEVGFVLRHEVPGGALGEGFARTVGGGGVGFGFFEGDGVPVGFGVGSVGGGGDVEDGGEGGGDYDAFDGGGGAMDGFEDGGGADDGGIEEVFLRVGHVEVEGGSGVEDRVEGWVGNDCVVEGGFLSDVFDDAVGELGRGGVGVVLQDGLTLFVGADCEDNCMVVAEESVDTVRGDEA